MKDIDFDELDKAVNSLMGGVKGKSDRPEAKTLTLTTTLKEGEQPEYDKIQHAAEKIGSETLLSPMEKTAILTGTLEDHINVLSLSDTPLEPLTLAEVVAPVVVEATAAPTPLSDEVQPTAKTSATKAPSGRFMDVMHPSSDMKTAQVKAAPTAPSPSPTQVTQPSIVIPSRPVAAAAGKVETPVEPNVLDEAPSVDAVPSTQLVVEDSPVVPVEVAPVAAEPAVVEAIEAPLASSVEQAVSISRVEVEPQVGAEQVEPLSSPFLPDAKVEKRPLGGTVDATSLDEIDINSFDAPYASDNSNDTQLSPTEANQSVLPDELHNDLLAIETNFAEGSELQTTPEVGDVSSAPVRTPEVDTSQTSDSSTNDESTDDTPENGAIFDTTNYHKSVSHPAKHTSEWVWIAVIVGIILVCAAGAAAFYLLGTK